jgi:hypothetical protein
MRENLIDYGWMIVRGSIKIPCRDSFASDEESAWEKLVLAEYPLRWWHFTKRSVAYDSHKRHVKRHIMGGIIESLKLSGYQAVQVETFIKEPK